MRKYVSNIIVTNMSYILTTKSGRKMEFKVQACAELYRTLLGGTVTKR